MIIKQDKEKENLFTLELTIEEITIVRERSTMTGKIFTIILRCALELFFEE